MFPVNIIRSVIKNRKLRKECLEEILQEAKLKGIDLIILFLTKSRWNRGKNRARIILEDLRRKNLPYSIDFYLLKDRSPVVTTFGKPSSKRFLPLKRRMYYKKDANESIPEGFVKPPIGETRNIEWNSCREKLEKIQRELDEDLKRRRLDFYQKELDRWASIPMEEWERKSGPTKCPKCEYGSIVDTVSGTQEHFYSKCYYCNGTGEITRTAEQVKRSAAPKYPEFKGGFIGYSRRAKKKLKELGIDCPEYTDPLLVYMKVTSKI